MALAVSEGFIFILLLFFLILMVKTSVVILLFKAVRDNGGLIKALKLFVKEGYEVDIEVNVQLCKVVIYNYVFCWL